MKRLLLYLAIAVCLGPGPAFAASASLQVNPLKYQSVMIGPDVRDGYVDVANPSDATVTITASVQGFRQTDLAGDLAFFNSPVIESGIKLSLTQFQLGPQQAVRVPFSVSPKNLPQGGVYAVIFFRTVPPTQVSSTSFVTESANVGTLLLLQNGPTGKHVGRITKFNLPFLELGNGLQGSAEYKNTNQSTSPVAFTPVLVARVEPLGKDFYIKGPYVLPESTRSLLIDRPGSYFGLLPISLIDQSSGLSTTRWVLACTGVYAFLVLYLVALLFVWTLSRYLRHLPLIPAFLARRYRPANAPVRPAMDGLAPKS